MEINSNAYLSQIFDSNYGQCPYSMFGSQVTEYVIGNSVTTIGSRAFSGCDGLTSVTIPNSVTTIGECAFSGCKGLTSVTIPNSVTTIGDGAFNYCSGLTSVTIPNSVTSIGSSAFSSCKGLTSITIPNSVTTIGERTFYFCSGLTSVTIGNSVTTIGREAFWGCSSLTSVTIPNSVTIIGGYAFWGCKGLTSVTILNPNIKIERFAFTDCTITDLYCRESVIFEILSKNVHHLSSEELQYCLPFDQYAKGFVESRINEWQKKGEFERTTDWQARVTETSRKQKIDALIRDAKKNYLTHYHKRNNATFSLGTYDADNEVYLVQSSNGQDLLVVIPFADASYVQQNWASCKASPQYDIQGTDIVLQSVDFTFPNKKTYTYKSTQDLTYAKADIQYNFAPIEINLPSNNAAPQPKGQQTIQQTQLAIGKSAVDTNIPKTNSVNDKTFVVILANEDYESVASVPFAKNDGGTFKKYCINTLGIPEKNIHLRENATLNNMRSELGWLKQVCEAYKGEASVIFYYAGHGIPDENDKSAYLLPADGDGRYVQSGYKLDDLYKNLGSMLAKSVTVFMDACFSGSQRGSGMLASARGIALKSKAGVPQGNMVVFSAAQGDETAYPNNEQGHGMFTYYLLKKLQETQGNVTLKDLGDYITTNVSQQSIVLNSKSQTPCVTPASAVADSWQNWKLK